MKTPYYRSAEFSNSKLDEVRNEIAKLTVGDHVVLVCGSYARREASSRSDFDFFIISDDDDGKRSIACNGLIDSIRDVVKNMPAKDGAFGRVVNRHSLLHHVGGEEDSNRNITQRILFLLEGDWLSNKEGFHGFRREILEKYIRESMTDHQLALFLLNDIIRSIVLSRLITSSRQ